MKDKNSETIKKNFETESKINEETKRSRDHLKKSKFLKNKIVKYPILYKFAKFIYKNYINIIGETRVLPDFILCGAPRCGTTSIYEGLSEHPNIFSAKVKEIYFFDGNFHRGENWYRYHFPPKLKKFIIKKILRKKFVTGEATPFYLIHPHAAQRIKKINSKTKLIVILRNPIDRAYSHFSSAIKNGKENFSFEESIKEEENRIKGEMEKMIDDESYYSSEIYYKRAYFLQGLYYNDLNQWMKVFPKNQFLIINSEEFFKNPSKNFNEIFKFLEISQIKNKKYVQFHLGKYLPMNQETREQLIKFYKPYNEKLYNLIGEKFDWDK
tara:strand:+ start:2295 stop:3269 length:975 start_codon:yes stop_codon:yes gene_type:complete